MTEQLSVQDLMTKELMFETSEDNETLQLLQFMRDEGVPLTNHQAAGLFLLKQNGLSELANYVMNIRRQMTPTKKFFDLVNKLTLADRIKGNAKLSGILKANANPANAAGLSMGKGEPMK